MVTPLTVPSFAPFPRKPAPPPSDGTREARAVVSERNAYWESRSQTLRQRSAALFLLASFFSGPYYAAVVDGLVTSELVLAAYQHLVAKAESQPRQPDRVAISPSAEPSVGVRLHLPSRWLSSSALVWPRHFRCASQEAAWRRSRSAISRAYAQHRAWSLPHAATRQLSSVRRLLSILHSLIRQISQHGHSTYVAAAQGVGRR